MTKRRRRTAAVDEAPPSLSHTTVISVGRIWEISSPRRASCQTSLNRSTRSFLLTTKITVMRNSREHRDHPSSPGHGPFLLASKVAVASKISLAADFLVRSISSFRRRLFWIWD
ncbi:hypothetical protein TIFTF001_029251 [Ficus carica]|uniref:Uncharacterized protein n=1 Tax=Ficus carica TaxID=3494 RepID=A0AA88DRK0_FICCA|nr:hypothetical protein TIFTF001_029251 [Ficus carica]